MPATFRFLEFFPSKLVYFWTKSRKKRYGCFFHSICATDLNFGTKNIERTKLSTLKTLIFANFWGPEVVGSSSYQKNIGAKFTHLYIPSLCKEFIVMRHNLGHSIMYVVWLYYVCKIAWPQCLSTMKHILNDYFRFFCNCFLNLHPRTGETPNTK